MGPDVVEANAVLIVVGSHLRAEEGDRPLAYRLKARIEAWRMDHADQLTVPLTPIVCTDLWYLNHEVLQQRPTVCIGGPGVNAYAALSMQEIQSQPPDQPSDLPPALSAERDLEPDPALFDDADADAAEDDEHQETDAPQDAEDPSGWARGEPRVTIMIDPDFTHLRVGIWGTDHALTAKGVELFSERYLDGYLRACVTQVEPQTE